MMKAKVMKVVLVFLILAVTTNATALASTTGYNRIARSKISAESIKSSSGTISYSAIHRVVQHFRGFADPDEVIMTTANPLPVTFESIIAVSIQISQPYSNNFFDIFIPPRTSF